MQIKHRYTGEVLLTVDADTLVGANLRGANLRGANLAEAYLIKVNLSGANLEGVTGSLYRSGFGTFFLVGGTPEQWMIENRIATGSLEEMYALYKVMEATNESVNSL